MSSTSKNEDLYTGTQAAIRQTVNIRKPTKNTYCSNRLHTTNGNGQDPMAGTTEADHPNKNPTVPIQSHARNPENRALLDTHPGIRRKTRLPNMPNNRNNGTHTHHMSRNTSMSNLEASKRTLALRKPLVARNNTGNHPGMRRHHKH